MDCVDVAEEDEAEAGAQDVVQGTNTLRRFTQLITFQSLKFLELIRQ